MGKARMTFEPKKIGAAIVVVLVLVIVVFAAIKTPIQSSHNSSMAIETSSISGSIPTDQKPLSGGDAESEEDRDASSTSTIVLVYYFHMTARCGPCIRMEEWTKEAVLSGFTDALKAGQLAWRAIDVEKSENDHFIDDYRLTDMSVVVTKIKDGRRIRYEILEESWSLLDDKAAFLRYVRNEVRSYLARG